MSFATFHSWWTVLMFVVFIGIVIWAWSSRRKTEFDAAARLPLEDDESMTADSSEGVKHG